jgi:Uma2 family endonuclease
MSFQPKPFLTLEEYLAGERAAVQKHEYFQGEVFAMGGASFSHVTIVSNLNATLHRQLQGKPCQAFAMDLRVNVSRTGLYTYPDIGVVCDEPQFDDERRDTLLNPRIIIEVLSSSTEAYDRGKKFAHYRTIESLTEYLLVAQDQPRVEQYIRQSSGDWLLHDATALDETIRLPSIGCELKLAEVYDRVEFSESE